MKLYIKRTVDMHSTCVLDAYILPFGYIYYNLDINMETRHIHITFRHFDPV